MKKTSRRAFGKTIASAAAGIPMMSLGSRIAAFADRGRPDDKILIECARSHENTPPPITLGDGSFNCIVRYAGVDAPLTQSGNGKEWYYQGDVNGGVSNTIAHLRVLHGCGTMLYEDLEAAGAVITIDLKNESRGRVGTLEISGESNAFKVKSTSHGNGSGKLKHSAAKGKPYHKHTWKHKGGGDDLEFRITRIYIAGGSKGPKEIIVDESCPFQSQEFRILIWLMEAHAKTR